MRNKAIALILITALTVGASYAVRTATESPRRAASSIDPVAAASGTFDPVELARLIRVYEGRVRHRPDALEYDFLAGLYLQREGLTSDIGSLLLAKTAEEEAVRLAPGATEFRARLAGIRASLHDFAGALSLAREILTDRPDDVAALSVLGDSLLEIGDHEAAATAYGRLAALLPGAAGVTVRLARLASLRGDAAGAQRLADRAYRAARAEGAFGPGLAWYLAYRSAIAFDTGDYVAAARLAEDALRASPDSPDALPALARARAAQGSLDEAIRLFVAAEKVAADPELLSQLGDLLARSGDASGAEQRYRVAERFADRPALDRRLYARAVAVFLADHGRNPSKAVRLASEDLEARPDIHGWDAYGWALYAAGRYGEARAASDRALALGTADAHLWYHAGMISAALGDTARARSELRRALRFSPAFDPLGAERAAATLSLLSAKGGTP